MVTLSQGKIVWMNGELRTERGAGRYVNRPAFATMFEAVKRQAHLHTPHAVSRDSARAVV
jgi:dihydropyrimidinase